MVAGQLPGAAPAPCVAGSLPLQARERRAPLSPVGRAAGPRAPAGSPPGCAGTGRRRRTACGPGSHLAPSRTACTLQDQRRHGRACGTSKRTQAAGRIGRRSVSASPPPATLEAHMPAALAAATPVGASSNTRQADGGGAGSQRDAASWKMSGAGLPLSTWSPAGQAADGVGRVGRRWGTRREVEPASHQRGCAPRARVRRVPSLHRCRCQWGWHGRSPPRPLLPTRDAVVEEREELAVPRGLERVVAQVGGGGQAQRHAVRRQVPQQPLCGACGAGGWASERGRMRRHCGGQPATGCCSPSAQATPPRTCAWQQLRGGEERVQRLLALRLHIQGKGR